MDHKELARLSPQSKLNIRQCCRLKSVHTHTHTHHIVVGLADDGRVKTFWGAL